MDRLKEYLSFAVWFAGLGYIPLWPLAASGPGGGLFGASVLCGGSAPRWLDLLCGAPHPLTLSPPLHVLGAASTFYVGICLLHRGWRRYRRARAAPPLRLPDKMSSAPHRAKLPLSARPIKPRSHFGLRGIERAPDLQDMA